MLERSLTTIANGLGVDEEKLRVLINLHPNEAKINEFNRYNKLFDSLDVNKAKGYLETTLDVVSEEEWEIKMQADDYLRNIIINGVDI